MSAVTKECGTPPFAQRRWRPLRRRPRARMADDCGRGLVREGASVHARGGEAGGGAELSSLRMGAGEERLRKGRGHAARQEGAGLGVTGGGVGQVRGGAQ